jgi:hypothetical protein
LQTVQQKKRERERERTRRRREKNTDRKRCGSVERETGKAKRRQAITQQTFVIVSKAYAEIVK